MSLLQTQESVDLAQRAIDSAPVLAISLIFSVGGIFMVSRLFMKSWQSSEEERRKTMDERHATYFSQLDVMNRAVVQAMDRGTVALEKATEAQKESTEVLGGVRELMRSIKP